jgi:hypothetical protein
MKMWCFAKSDIANKMLRIARCGVAFPNAWVADDIFGVTPGGSFLLHVFINLG